MIYIYSKSFFPRKTFGFEADQEDEISDEDEDDGLDENDSDCHTITVSKKEKSRPCLVGRKFSVFSIQTFRKQGKHV